MNKITPNISRAGDSWDTYWQGTGDIGAFTNGGVSHPAIRAFWTEFFNSVTQTYIHPKVLDIASGNGAVVDCALEAFKDIPNEITSLDVSEAAIKNIHTRFPNVRGIVSDACSIPAQAGSFDIVTSQYGVEYAGQEAILEAARLVSDNCVLVLLMHCDSGFIHQECKQSLDAVKRAQTSKFIPLAINMFDAGFKSIGGADRGRYEQAGKELAPAIAELESIMKQYGSDVAGDTISRLYNDVGQIHQRMQHYDVNDVLTWLNRTSEELNAYIKRMSSMSKSAVSTLQFDQIKDDLIAKGFSLETADKLFAPNNQLPMAWVLIAKK
jgi:ubiquinone/menaquinone biosynthesis C-methylase UbiE